MNLSQRQSIGLFAKEFADALGLGKDEDHCQKMGSETCSFGR